MTCTLCPTAPEDTAPASSRRGFGSFIGCRLRVLGSALRLSGSRAEGFGQRASRSVCLGLWLGVEKRASAAWVTRTRYTATL